MLQLAQQAPLSKSVKAAEQRCLSAHSRQWLHAVRHHHGRDFRHRSQFSRRLRANLAGLDSTRHAMGAANDGDLSRRERHAWRAAVPAQQLSASARPILAQAVHRDSSTKPPAAIRRANPASSSCDAGCAPALLHRCSTPIRNRLTTTQRSAARGTNPALRKQISPRAHPRHRSANAQIAQDWLDLKAERSLSSFDQRHLLNLQAQYTTGQGLEGGTLLGGWRGKALKEWTLLTQLNVGTGLPETPIYSRRRSGHWLDRVRCGPALPAHSIYGGQNGAHLNAAAYTCSRAQAPGAPQAETPSPGQISSASTAVCSARFAPASTSISTLASTQPTC